MREVPLSRGRVALVDDADYDSVIAVGKWYANPSRKTFYARKNFATAPGKWTSVRMHTFLTGWPLVDHVNGNGLDNQRANLRPASSRQNSQNRGLRSDNTSGYKGVSWKKKDRLWVATISVNGKPKHIGCFSSAIDGAIAYDAAAVHYFGAFARLNFPEEIAA